LGVVSNYIFDDGDIRYGDHDIVTASLEQDEVPGDQIIGQTSGNANTFRDELAQRMWRDYCTYIETRQQHC
jgi:hypothetical protein